MNKRVLFAATAALAFLCASTAAAQTAQPQTTSGFDTPVGSGLPLVFANEGQQVGVWSTASLNVTGGLQVGYDGTACSAANEGEQRYNKTVHYYEYCNGSAWTPMTGASIGIGQKWQNINGSFWTVYQNTSSRAIEIALACYNTQNQASRYYVYVNGIIISAVGATYGGQGDGFSFIVPPGATYEVANPDDSNGMACYWSALQ